MTHVPFHNRANENTLSLNPRCSDGIKADDIYCVLFDFVGYIIIINLWVTFSRLVCSQMKNNYFHLLRYFAEEFLEEFEQSDLNPFREWKTWRAKTHARIVTMSRANAVLLLQLLGPCPPGHCSFLLVLLSILPLRSFCTVSRFSNDDRIIAMRNISRTTALRRLCETLNASFLSRNFQPNLIFEHYFIFVEASTYSCLIILGKVADLFQSSTVTRINNLFRQSDR